RRVGGGPAGSGARLALRREAATGIGGPARPGEGEDLLVGRDAAGPVRRAGLVALPGPPRVDGVGQLPLRAGEVLVALVGPHGGQRGGGGVDLAGRLVAAALAQRGAGLLEVAGDRDRGLDRPRPLGVEDL